MHYVLVLVLVGLDEREELRGGHLPLLGQVKGVEEEPRAVRGREALVLHARGQPAQQLGRVKDAVGRVLAEVQLWGVCLGGVG